MSYLAMVKRAESQLATVGVVPDFQLPTRAWVLKWERADGGDIRGVMLCSAPLAAHIWVLFDHDFKPADDLAIYYAEELPALRSKTVDELRYIQNVKLVFPGARVIQD